MARTVPRDAGDLEARLRHQHSFLVRSSWLYDCGHWEEAARLAVAIRILVHPSGGTPLLESLGLLADMQFLDTAIVPPAQQTIDGVAVVPVFLSGSAVQPSLRRLVQLTVIDSAATWVPLLDTTATASSFEEWWATPVVQVPSGGDYTRKDIVLVMANQDGGAHVAPRLDRAYAELYNSDLGVQTATGGDFTLIDPPGGWIPPVGNVAYASVRQMAHETIRSLEVRAPEILGVT